MHIRNWLPAWGLKVWPVNDDVDDITHGRAEGRNQSRRCGGQRQQTYPGRARGAAYQGKNSLI